MRWMFRPHVLQHRPTTPSMFLALHHVQGKLLPPPVVFCCSTNSAQQCFCWVLAVQGRAAQPAAGIWYLLSKGKAFFCCRHNLPLLIQGPGSLSTDYDSLQVRLLHSAAFSVSFVRALQPGFHLLSPELGLVCAGFFLLFCLGWGGLPGLGSSFMCGSISADVCLPLRERQFVCLNCVFISLFCLALSFLM